MKERVWRASAAIVGGLLIALSLPFLPTAGSEVPPLAWLALVPILFALRDLSPTRAFL